MRGPALNATFIPNIDVEMTPLRVKINGMPLVGWRRAVIVTVATPAFIGALLAWLLVLMLATPALLLARTMASSVRTEAKP